MQPPESPSRYVPRAVVREVYTRDAEQCSFVSPEGRRCASRGFLELQHEKPHACGGLPTPENLKILCRSHNALMAERDFGRAFIQERLSRARRRTECAPSESWSRNHDP
jgi:5-methylcytosine-specific restriction endonuclease McrA